MARSIVDPNVPIREALQPQREVVSTYVRPPTPEPSNLHQLADALGNFSRNIGGMLKERQKKTDDADTMRGKKAALIANGAAYAEGVRTGVIGAGDSPMFIESYKNTQGEILGKRLASQASAEYQSWEGRNDQDPANFDTFLGQFMEKNLTGIEDPDVLKGVLPYLENTATAMYNTNTTERNKAVYNGAIDANIASTAMDIDTEFDLGIARGGDVNYEDMWTNITDTREAALATGVVAADYDAKLYTAIAQKAIEHHDPAILALLDKPMPGMDIPYSATPDGITLKAATINAFETEWAAETRAKEAAQKEADEKKKDAYTREAIKLIGEDPGHNFDEDYLDAASAVDPTFRVRIQEWRDKAKTAEDPTALLAVQHEIMSGQYGYDDLMVDMGKDGRITDPATANQMSALIDRVNDNNKSAMTENETYKKSMTFLQQQLTEQDIFSAGGLSSDAIAAQLDFQTSMLDWYEKNPEAGYNEISQQAYATVQRIKQGIQEGGFEGSTYKPAAGAPSEAIDQITAMEQEVPGVPDPTAEAADADPMVVWQTEVPPTMDQLNPDQRTAIEEKARELGVPPDLYIKTLHQNLSAAGKAGPEVEEAPEGAEEPAAEDQSAVEYRNNNPGNLKLTDFTRAAGATGADERGIAIFPDGETGRNAMAKLLFESDTYKDLTLSEAINTYAPASDDNDPEGYVEFLAQQTGLQPDAKLSELDDGQRDALIDAMTRMEGAAAPTEDGVSLLPASLDGDGLGSAAAIQAVNAGNNKPLQVAQAYLGYDERNPEQAKALAAFFKKAGGLTMNPANTPWCAGLVNAVLGQAGFEGSGKASARSFLNVGTKVTTPQPGDIAVYWRGKKDGWQGHVGIVAKVYPNGDVDLLGGNQSTKESKGQGVTVNVKRTGSGQLLGYRRPTPKKAKQFAEANIAGIASTTATA